MSNDLLQVWYRGGLFTAIFRWTGNAKANGYTVVYGCEVHATQLQGVVDDFGNLVLQPCAETPAVVVEMDGGAIHRVVCTQPIRVTILDDDTESADPDLVRLVGAERRMVAEYPPIAEFTDAFAVKELHQLLA